MTNQEVELIFVFAGMAWAGLGALGLAVFMGIRKLRTPKPSQAPKDWEDMIERWKQ